MKRKIVNIGDIFTRLEVVEILSGLDIRVRCTHHPKKTFDIKRSSLFNGLTKSCGCLNDEKRSERVKTHGLSHLRIYHTFNSMVKRCYNKKDSGYSRYGGRGIKICQDWNPYLLGWEESFTNFKLWADGHGYTGELTIERIDNDVNYCPNNCKFITKIEQADHKRRSKYFTYKGITKTARQWSRDPLCVVSSMIFYNGMRLGWDIKEALTTKLMANNQRK